VLLALGGGRVFFFPQSQIMAFLLGVSFGLGGELAIEERRVDHPS